MLSVESTTREHSAEKRDNKKMICIANIIQMMCIIEKTFKLKQLVDNKKSSILHVSQLSLA